MKIILSILLIILVITSKNFSTNKFDERINTMKLNVGIITQYINESKTFYIDKLGFEIVFENEWFLLISTPDGKFITIEVQNVDEKYEEIKKLNIPIEVEIRDEEWGDRHFAIVDPNGIGIDFVTNNLFDNN